ncbi:MAG: hypothetical protein M1812_004083 [Candelaria pacifica]|nr:MAG: hypothetical protein M1812_004083 [Candelaria pacifica]
MASSAGSGSAANAIAVVGNGARQGNGKSTNTAQSAGANCPPPKTDKPRPHVCGTCSRSFARLEHLKRHERSHTKEKPFECPECTRCFARRDLLLRHQQKLHMTATASARPRNGRRESTSSTAGSGPGRVRKNSVANSAVGSSGVGSMRPRANTISHVDNTTLGLIAAANSSITRNGHMGSGHAHHPSLGHLPGPGGYEFRGMSTAMGNHGNPHGLPKLDTHGHNMNMSGGLRTAPAFGGFGSDHDVDSLLFGGPNSTINPAQLHFSDSPQSLAFGIPTSPYNNAFPGMTANQAVMDEDDSFDWMGGFDNQMSFGAPNNEHAIDGSSPSAISTASQSGISEVMLDGSNNPVQTPATTWQNAIMPPPQVATNPFTMDAASTTFPEMISPPGTVSPKSLHAHNGGNDLYFSAPPSLTTLSSTSMMPGIPNQLIHPPMTYNPETLMNSSAVMDGSPHLTLAASPLIQAITDNTRQALLSTLSQSSTFGHKQRKYSQPTVSSPLSPGFLPRLSGFHASLPSTTDLQRYIRAYVQYFHPHLPFLHIPTLNLESLIYTDNSRLVNGQASYNQTSQTGGGGCLVLSMAAIGALYEFDHTASGELFEGSKKMIQLYLEDRRKSDRATTTNGPNLAASDTVQNTPLWLVQAMLLNVIYGHNCGDKTAADIASTHCVALVRLARAAELAHPIRAGSVTQGQSSHTYDKREPSEDIQMGDDGFAEDAWNLNDQQDFANDENEWHSWKTSEERKRTLYTIFILSSLLVSAYNHPPVLINSEIQLDLPCDEDIWAAESVQAWSAKGGRATAEQNATSFATALSTLLTAGQRQRERQQQHMPQSFRRSLEPGASFEGLPEGSLTASTFGCLVLINALHNYIWETRQRHLDRPWTTQETEAMHAHIEPALMAWQTTWASNPHHTAERPNPFGMGPLSADSIPLLDLAYIRLFVNLGRSKDAFWQRDYDGMAEELARGAEIIQHAEHSPSIGSSGSDIADSINSFNSGNASPSTANTSPDLHAVKTPTSNHPISSLAQTEVPSSGHISKRERHLRKAAFYAADSLSMSDKLGVTFADFTSRELPLQSALCAFDCAQVLAEWISTVQERVGRYLGILGKDDVDYTQVPGIMLLEDEDCKLLEKVTEVLNSAEIKMTYEAGGMGAMATMTGTKGMPSFRDCGFGSKILMVTAYMLDKAAVWPVTRLMAQSLETQAAHINARAESSLLQQQ